MSLKIAFTRPPTSFPPLTVQNLKPGRARYIMYDIKIEKTVESAWAHRVQNSKKNKGRWYQVTYHTYLVNWDIARCHTLNLTLIFNLSFMV